MNNHSIAPKPTNNLSVFNLEPYDSMKPDDIGAMDAKENFPFAPEMYYVKHSDMCLYAAGWVTVKGASYLTDFFLLGSAVESIEDDYQFIQYGGA